MKSSFFKFILLILALIILIPTIFGNKGLLKILRTKKSIQEVRAEVLKLKKEKTDLEREIEWLKDHQDSLEPFAKDKLLLREKGEKVIVIIPEKEQAQGPQ